MIIIKNISQEILDDAVRALYDSIGFILNEKNDPYLDWDNQTICNILNNLSTDLNLYLRFYTDSREIVITSTDFEYDFHFFSELVAVFDSMFPACLEGDEK